MKKTLLINLILVSLGLSLQTQARIEIFTCEPEWKALAEAIGGDKVTAQSATTAFQDPHYVDPKPSLIAKVRSVDLIICSGSGLEADWLPLLLRQSANPKIQIGKAGYFMATEQVPLIEVPAQTEQSSLTCHGSGNPHVHLDPYRLINIADSLFKRLEYIDTKNSDYYKERLDTFKTQWQTAALAWEESAAKLKGKKAIVYHANWSYLALWLGIKIVGDIEPKPGLPATSSHLAKLLALTKQEKPDFIFKISCKVPCI
jgi:zinc/manganese transport system substrate-binding protein